MKEGLLLIAGSISMLAISSPSQAQDMELTRPITVSYTGTVVDDVRNSIRIMQPDGSTVPYVGPVPDYPYNKGDQVNISFQTVVPTSAYYDRYVGQQSSDGMYRFRVYGPSNSYPPIDPNGFGKTNSFDVSGPIKQDVGNGELLGSSGLFIVYNANNDTYGIDPASSWLAGNFDAPTYVYDFVSQSMRLSNTSCLFYGQCENAGLVLSGAGGNVSLGKRRGDQIAMQIGDSSQPNLVGFFDFNLTGGWTVSTNATQVPEPSVIVLFGSAAAGLMFARRRKRKTA